MLYCARNQEKNKSAPEAKKRKTKEIITMNEFQFFAVGSFFDAPVNYENNKSILELIRHLFD